MPGLPTLLYAMYILSFSARLNPQSEMHLTGATNMFLRQEEWPSAYLLLFSELRYDSW